MLAGTPYAYIRTPINAGDHVVESLTEDVKWAAWTYGSLDGLQMGRAYGTPVSVDLTIPCPDSLKVTETIACGDVTGIGQIIPEDIACGSIFAVYADDLNNYVLVEDPEFNSGDKKVNFWLNVVDKTQDASGTVRVVTRSGKFVEKTYTYVADKIAWTPDKIDFGVIPFNTPVTKDFTLQNLNPNREVNIRKLRAKYFPDVYSFSPESFTIPAGGSQIVRVTALIKDARAKLDTVIAELDCFEKLTVELNVRGEEPMIYVGDQTWTNIPVSAGGVEKDVVIQNGSPVDLIITGYEESKLPMVNDGVAHFYNPVNLKEKLPITLHGNEKHVFKVTYNPQGDAVNQHRVDVKFFSNAVQVDDIAILIGNGVMINLSAAAPPWNVRVIDNVQTAQTITEYPEQIKFSNYGSQPVVFNTPFIRGVDAGAFRIVDQGNTGGFPTQLVGGGPNQERYITVAFVPTELPNRAAERNNYVAEVVFPTNDPGAPEIKADLIGTAWQPQVKAADYNFGSFQVGSAAVTTDIVVTNDNYQDASNPTSGDTKGTHGVIVTGIEWADANDPDNARFEILDLPSPANPWRIGINSGDEMKMRVRFNPSVSGTFEAEYNVITQPADMTDGAAPYTPKYKLSAVVAGGEFSVTDAYSVQYVHNSKDMFITIKHDEPIVKRFTIGNPVGTDASRFTVLDPPTGYIDVAPGQEGIVRVEFIPDYVTQMNAGQTDQWLTKKGNPSGVAFRAGGMFQSDILFTDESNGKTQTSHLTGDGIYIETTNFIRSDYKVRAGESFTARVELEAVPESIDQPQLKDLRVRIQYDGNLIRPVKDNTLSFAGTILEGWSVASFSQMTDHMFEVDLTAGTTGQAIAHRKDAVGNPLPLFKINFNAFLAYSANTAARFSSDIIPYTYWVDVDQSGERREYCVIRDIAGKVDVELDCAKQLRLVSIGRVPYGVKPISPNPVSSSAVINYSIGLDGQTTIVLYNSNGERVLDLIDTHQDAGEYELTLDLTQLPAGTYYYRVVSGPYTSEPQVITVIK
jgi:hypothetical protein